MMRGNPHASCPHCRAELGAFTFGDDDGKVELRAGLFSICKYRNGPLVFNADLTLRKPTAPELELLTRAAHAKANRELEKRAQQKTPAIVAEAIHKVRQMKH